jgi:hypothetical protein
MTEKLQKAFAEAEKLSEAEQDRVAQWLLAELQDDRAWDETFANSADKLAALADEALDDHAQGRTKCLDTGRF